MLELTHAYPASRRYTICHRKPFRLRLWTCILTQRRSLVFLARTSFRLGCPEKKVRSSDPAPECTTPSIRTKANLVLELPQPVWIFLGQMMGVLNIHDASRPKPSFMFSNYYLQELLFLINFDHAPITEVKPPFKVLLKANMDTDGTICFFSTFAAVPKLGPHSSAVCRILIFGIHVIPCAKTSISKYSSIIILLVCLLCVAD